MGLLAPLFVLGAGLIAVPWLIHRIRRPERETVRFSSLMFVPNVKREVIERRRVQHVWLLLLRMLLLALLALAFARPYRERFLGAAQPQGQVTYHALVLDASMSMATAGTWEAAKRQAHAALAEVRPGDRVGVVTFGQTARVEAPLSEDLKGARAAVDAAAPTWERTDFAAGLQAAEGMLLAAPGDEARRVAHLISDFQASGLPDGETVWRLSPAVALDPLPVGAEGVPNASIDALAVRAVADSLLQVRAQVRNWGNAAPATVRLVLDEREAGRRETAISEGHASLVAFDVAVKPGERLAGYVALAGGDGLGRDDRRFFVWQPAPPQQVLVRSAGGGQAAYDRLVLAAVPGGAGLPWAVTVAGAREWDEALEASSPPAVMVAGDVADGGSADRLLAYVRGGGKLLLLLRAGAHAEALNRLLGDAGVRVGGTRFGRAQSSIYEPLAWVDLSHRIFHPFRDARFNDFSAVRFYNYHRLTVAPEPAVVLARFENGAPAMAAAPLGKGQVVVWAGGADPAWANLARTPRFVPLLHETLRFLAGKPREPAVLVVGDPSPVAGVTREDGDAAPPGPDGRLGAPGIYRWPAGEGRLAAVNVDARESDPVRTAPAELEIRLCHAPAPVRGDGGGEQAGDRTVRDEYGHWGIVALFALLLFEHGYAARLGSQSAQEFAG